MNQIEIFNKAFPNAKSHAFSQPLVLETIEPMDFRDYRLYYCKAACFHVQRKSKAKAVENIEKALGIIGDIMAEVELPQPTICKLYQLAAEIYADAGDIQSSENYYKKFYYESYKSVCNFDYLESANVYTFRSLSKHALLDLINGEITVSHPSTMNDPFDSAAEFLSRPNNLKRICNRQDHVKTQSSMFRYFRIRSFVSGEPCLNMVNSTLMWSHYADYHKGICIGYSLSGRFTNCFEKSSDDYKFSLVLPVQYSDESRDIHKTLDTVNSFTQKRNCWEYENEIRLVTFNTSNDKPHVGLPLDEDSFVKEIIFGYACPEKEIDTIKKLLEGDKRITFSKMITEDHDFTRLIKKPL